MKNNPIGIFDSGLGGLTVMSEVIKRLPGEDIVYFGDTARVPYGSKSKEVVSRYAMQISSFLLKKKVKLIVVACNTASAFALPLLRRKLSVPVIGVIEPGARQALKITNNRRIGVIGTEGTIKSSSYVKAIKKLGGSKNVFTQACPLFVPLAEEGWLNNKVTALIANEYLKPLVKKNIDTLILGCTHYPLLKKTIGSVTGRRARIVDSATATAQEVAGILDSEGMCAQRRGKARYQYYVSDYPEKFRDIGQRFLGRHILNVRKVNLDEI